MYFGVCVTILITFFWVGTTHCFKFLFLPSTRLHHSLSSTLRGSSTHQHTTTSVLQSLALPYSSSSVSITTQDSLFSENATSRPSKAKAGQVDEHHDPHQFRAPFFASWFCTNFVILFFPIYLMFRGLAKRCGANTETMGDILQGFRDRGFTIGRFINRCITFCILWVLATYLYMKSLKELFSTDVIVLFATNVASVYLLSWVILHEQFVGVRVCAWNYFRLPEASISFCRSSQSFWSIRASRCWLIWTASTGRKHWRALFSRRCPARVTRCFAWCFGRWWATRPQSDESPSPLPSSESSTRHFCGPSAWFYTSRMSKWCRGRLWRLPFCWLQAGYFLCSTFSCNSAALSLTTCSLHLDWSLRFLFQLVSSYLLESWWIVILFHDCSVGHPALW